jgi:large subunit ribosomal protein L21
MYAIIRTGGKQYKVQPGDTLRVEKLEKELGSEFDLTEILVVGGDKTFVGQPLVKNAKVTVVVTRQAQHPKVIIFKKRRRQGYRRLRGHRQQFTEIFVKSITSPEGMVASTDTSADVVDVAARNADRITAKVAARKERVSKEGKAKAAAEGEELASASKKATAKKAPVKAKKAAPKKAKAAAGKKKKAAPKKASSKSKTTKKTKKS